MLDLLWCMFHLTWTLFVSSTILWRDQSCCSPCLAKKFRGLGGSDQVPPQKRGQFLEDGVLRGMIRSGENLTGAGIPTMDGCCRCSSSGGRF